MLLGFGLGLGAKVRVRVRVRVIGARDIGSGLGAA